MDTINDLIFKVNKIKGKTKGILVNKLGLLFTSVFL